MNSKAVHKLKIDPNFKILIRPLQRKEYLQLEANIMADGCRDAIITWNGFIVDGHNRYEICSSHQIPFEIMEMEFECREAAIAWICSNQLGRRNITEETRKFLIGMQYESEKIVATKRNAQGINQHSDVSRRTGRDGFPNDAMSRHQTAQKIAEEHHISNGSVQKYAVYTRALEEIGKAAPALVPKILSGHYKISHKNIVDLSKMSPADIKKVARKIELSQKPFVQYHASRGEIQQTGGYTPANTLTVPTIKDMPKYDPDAEITGLTLTIPSWASSIDRTRSKADFENISDNARLKLYGALQNLMEAINEMMSAIKED